MSAIDVLSPAVRAVEDAVAVEVRRKQRVELDGDADFVGGEQLADRVEIALKAASRSALSTLSLPFKSALMPISASMSNGPVRPETFDVSSRRN